MQKWEYLILNFYHLFPSERIVRLSINHEGVEPIERAKGLFSEDKYPEWAASLSKCLPRLGEEGWELVSATMAIGSTGNTGAGEREFIFKRPKRE
jgi:hypothetical protein